MINVRCYRKRWTAVLAGACGIGAWAWMASAAGLSISAGTVTLATNANIVTTGDVVLSGGQLIPNAGSLTLGGNWTYTSGTFTHGTSTVTFQGAAGSTSTLTGSTSFYTLSCVTAGKYIDFPAASTQTIMGTLILQGSSGNLIGVRSTSSGNYAYLNDSGLNSVVYTSAKDNNAKAGAIIQAGTTSSDGGNNINWLFGPEVLSVSLSPSTYSFGTVAMAATTVSVSAIVATNNGNVSESFSLAVSSGTTWLVNTSTPTSMDHFALMGLFNSVQPSSSVFVTSDILTTVPTAATAVQFAGNQTGTGVAVSGTADFWMRLDMPLATGSTVQQNMALSFTASNP